MFGFQNRVQRGHEREVSFEWPAFCDGWKCEFVDLKETYAEVCHGCMFALHHAMAEPTHGIFFRLLHGTARTNSAFHVGELCVCCKEEPEVYPIVFRCPRWHKEQRAVELPDDADEVPPCFKLHGLVPAPQLPAIRTFEPALECRPGVTTVWTDGSGRHSITGDAELVTTPTLKKECFVPYQASSSRCT
eukprot:5522413-Amphidinium_carterae.1